MFAFPLDHIFVPIPGSNEIDRINFVIQIRYKNVYNIQWISMFNEHTHTHEKAISITTYSIALTHLLFFRFVSNSIPMSVCKRFSVSNLVCRRPNSEQILDCYCLLLPLITVSLSFFLSFCFAGQTNVNICRVYYRHDLLCVTRQDI